MEAGTLRGLFTLFMFVAFFGTFFWAWSSRRKKDFDAAANLPLEHDEFVSVDGKPTGVVPPTDHEQGKSLQGEDE